MLFNGIAITQKLSALAVALSFCSTASAAMKAMDDSHLSEVSGQSLFTLQYIAPSERGNPSTTIGFYRLGMEAQLDMNANIKKLQLGCGGTKGAGLCDIDIDDLKFTGIVPTINQTGGTDAGPKSDFTMINPTFDIAIENPGSASTRKIAGIRIGAESIWGMMSFGKQPTGTPGSGGANDPNLVANHTGINRLSAHLPTYMDNIKIPTTICTFSANDPTGCGSGGSLTSTTSTIDVDQPNTGDNRFDLYARRDSSIFISGAKAVSLLNLTINSDMDQSLKFIHNMQIGTDTNGNGKYDAGESARNFGISLQDRNLSWLIDSSTNNWAVADKGWWMEMPLGRVGDFTTRRVYATLGAVFGLTLKDVNQNQFPVDNCYGGLTFC